MKDILENNVDEKYYYNNEKAQELMRIIVDKYNKKSVIPCDSTLNQPKELDVANCITARYDAGIQNQRSIGVAVVEPIIAEARCDEGVRFFKDNVCGTIRTIQSGGDKVVLEPQQNRLGGVFDDEKGKHQAGSVWDKDGLAPTLDTMQGGWRQPMILEDKIIGSTQKNAYIGNLDYSPTLTQAMGAGGGHVPMICYHSDFRIRKLTPKECWRLMGVSDDDFEQTQKYNSNSALYKQAGNSIVVDVLEKIFKNMEDVLCLEKN